MGRASLFRRRVHRSFPGGPPWCPIASCWLTLSPGLWLAVGVALDHYIHGLDSELHHSSIRTATDILETICLVLPGTQDIALRIAFWEGAEICAALSLLIRKLTKKEHRIVRRDVISALRTIDKALAGGVAVPLDDIL